MGFLWCFTLPLNIPLSKTPQILISIWTRGILQTGRNSFTRSETRPEILNFSQVPQSDQWFWFTDNVFSCKHGDFICRTDIFVWLGEFRHSTVAKNISIYENLVFSHTFHSTRMNLYFVRLFLFFQCQVMYYWNISYETLIWQVIL